MIKPKKTKSVEPKRMWDVDVYNGKHLLTVIRVGAKDQEEASKLALNQFFEDINVKIRRSYT